MAKRVPALEKAMRVLRLIGFNSEETFTLSRISQETETSLSTCHAIVMALCDEGFLLRHERTKSYSLGPTALELGTLAAAQFPGAALARDELARMGRTFGVSAILGARSDDEIVIVGHHDHDLVPLGPNRTGFRGPMVPPLGLLFMAWASTDEVERWLQRRHELDGDGEADRYRAELVAIRNRGYWLSRGATVQDLVLQMAASLAHEHDSAARLATAAKIADMMSSGSFGLTAPTNAARPDHVGAPIFNADGQVALTLTLVAPPGAFDDTRAKRAPAELLAVCDEVTTALGGTPQRRRAAASSAKKSRPRAVKAD